MSAMLILPVWGRIAVAFLCLWSVALPLIGFFYKEDR